MHCHVPVPFGNIYCYGGCSITMLHCYTHKTPTTGTRPRKFEKRKCSESQGWWFLGRKGPMTLFRGEVQEVCIHPWFFFTLNEFIFSKSSSLVSLRSTSGVTIQNQQGENSSLQAFSDSPQKHSFRHFFISLFKKKNQNDNFVRIQTPPSRIDGFQHPIHKVIGLDRGFIPKS